MPLDMGANWTQESFQKWLDEHSRKPTLECTLVETQAKLYPLTYEEMEALWRVWGM